MAEAVSSQVGDRMVDASPFRVKDSCSQKACSAASPAGEGRPAYRDFLREGRGNSHPSEQGFAADSIGGDILGRQLPKFHIDQQFGPLATPSEPDQRDLPAPARTIDDSGVNSLYEKLNKPLLQ
jgi:hypothetical protein